MQQLADLLGHEPTKSEMQRIIDLPVKPAGSAAVPDEVVEFWNQKTRTPGGSWSLRPIQAAALHELYWNRALLGSIGVGFGKTLITLLAHHALPDIDPSRFLLVVPANMRKSLGKAATDAAQHFDINRKMHIASYAQISHPDQGPTFFANLLPKVLIFDEAHKIKNPQATRTWRVGEYAKVDPNLVFALVSGTLFTDIRAAAHLAELALKDRSPLPRTWTSIEDLAVVCHPNEYPQEFQWNKAKKLTRTFHPQGLQDLDRMPIKIRRETIRTAVHQRLSTAPGVVQTSMEELGVALNIQPLTPNPPQIIRDTMKEVSETWVTPSGQEVDSPADMSRVLHQLSMGMYYRWVWPNGKPDGEWLYARNWYAREIRRICRYYRSRGAESPALARRMADAGELDHEEDFMAALKEWKKHEHKPEPPVEAVWLTKWFIEHLMTRAERNGEENALIWYRHTELAKELAKKEWPVTVVWPGEEVPPNETPLPVACSVQSHGTGTNLQGKDGEGGWGRAIITSMLSNGETLEQLLGRIHRTGQWRDEVCWEIYQHTAHAREASRKARVDTKKNQDLTQQPQRFLYATILDEVA